MTKSNFDRALDAANSGVPTKDLNALCLEARNFRQAPRKRSPHHSA